MKYTGTLKKPVTRKRMGLLQGEDVYQAEAKRIADETFAKFPELFKAHDVPEGNWLALAVALAQAHVPGFKVVKPPGRTTKWGLAEKAEFRLDVDTIIDSTGWSVVRAIRKVMRTEPWLKVAEPMTIGALEQHYYTADLRFVEVVRSARAWQALPQSERDSYESIGLNN